MWRSHHCSHHHSQHCSHHTTTMATSCFLLHLFHLLLFHLPLVSSASVRGVVAEVKVDNFTNVVDQIFHGVALDSSLFSLHGLRGNISLGSPKLRSLLRALSPCHLRVGGTAANWVFFDQPPSSIAPLHLDKATILSKELFDSLVNITLETGNRLIYDLNAEFRYGQQWNPSDALRLFRYCAVKGYGSNIDWELGNEPNHISPSQLTPEQVAADTISIHTLLQQFPLFHNTSLLGPDVGWDGMLYLSRVADVAGDFLHAYSIHQYYFNGKEATVDNYTDSTNFIKLDKLFNKIRFALHNTSHSQKAWWLGETSSGYNSGTRGVSDRFVSGFLYLEKLGFSAANNVDVVIRQTIFNGDYGLVDLKTFDPFPDYWLIWVHHHLVGRGVFNVTLKPPLPDLRVYAQCTKQGSGYAKGSVVMFALNVHKTEAYKLTSTILHTPVEAFVLSPPNDDLLSLHVNLNGKLLEMVGDQMPLFPAHGVVVSEVILQPSTFAFYVDPKADVKLCKNFQD